MRSASFRLAASQSKKACSLTQIKRFKSKKQSWREHKTPAPYDTAILTRIIQRFLPLVPRYRNWCALQTASVVHCFNMPTSRSQQWRHYASPVYGVCAWLFASTAAATRRSMSRS